MVRQARNARDQHGWRSNSSRSPGIDDAAVIDVHAHVRLQATTAPRAAWPGIRHRRKRQAVVSRRQLQARRRQAHRQPVHRSRSAPARMDEAHIDFQVLSPSPLTYFHHIELRRSARVLPPAQRRDGGARASLSRPAGRARGAADAGSGRAQSKSCIRAVRELGLWGAAIGTEFAEPLHSPALDPFYETLRRARRAAVHPSRTRRDRRPAGRSRISSASTSTSSSASARRRRSRSSTLIFGGVLDRHPKLDVWISHGGGALPMMVGRLAQAAQQAPVGVGRAQEGGRVRGAPCAPLVRHASERRARACALKQIVGTRAAHYGTNFAGWDQSGGGDHGPIDPALADNARRLLRKGGTAAGMSAARNATFAVLLHRSRALAAADGAGGGRAGFEFVGVRLLNGQPGRDPAPLIAGHGAASRDDRLPARHRHRGSRRERRTPHPQPTCRIRAVHRSGGGAGRAAHARHRRRSGRAAPRRALRRAVRARRRFGLTVDLEFVPWMSFAMLHDRSAHGARRWQPGFRHRRRRAAFRSFGEPRSPTSPHCRGLGFATCSSATRPRSWSAIATRCSMRQ